MLLFIPEDWLWLHTDLIWSCWKVSLADFLVIHLQTQKAQHTHRKRETLCDSSISLFHSKRILRDWLYMNNSFHTQFYTIFLINWFKQQKIRGVSHLNDEAVLFQMCMYLHICVLCLLRACNSHHYCLKSKPKVFLDLGEGTRMRRLNNSFTTRTPLQI